MRATGEQSYDIMDLDTEPTLSAPTFDTNGDTADGHCSPMPAKRSRVDENFPRTFPVRGGQQQAPFMTSTRPTPPAVPLPISIVTSSGKQPNILTERQSQATLKIPSTISISTARVPAQDFVDESEYSDSDNNSQVGST